MNRTRNGSTRTRTQARAQAQRPSFVRRHPILTAGAIAAGIGGAYALLGRRHNGNGTHSRHRA